MHVISPRTRKKKIKKPMLSRAYVECNFKFILFIDFYYVSVLRGISIDKLYESPICIANCRKETSPKKQIFQEKQKTVLHLTGFKKNVEKHV